MVQYRAKLYKGTFLLFLLLAITYSANCQNPQQNLEKYKNYRQRLSYFVVVGDQPGQSIIAAIRNHINHNPGTIRFGQHITYFGEYLGVLATEYKLLEKSNKNTEKTLTELYYALEAYRRLDLCESKYPWNQKQDFRDGFVIRNDQDKDFLKIDHNQKVLNYNLDPSKDNLMNKRKDSPGSPAYIDRFCSTSWKSEENLSPEEKMADWKKNSVSQDDICPLLSGLALVLKCLPDSAITIKDFENNTILYNFADTARLDAYLSVRLMSNTDKQYGNKKWNMYRPDSSRMEWYLGGNTYFYGTGYVRTLDYFFESNDLEETVGNFQNIVWQLCQIFPLPNFDNRSMLSHLGVVSDSWKFLFFNTTYSGIKKQAMVNGWQPYYLMMWKYLHTKSKKLNRQKIEKHLNSAPKDGPYCYKVGEEYAKDRWASSSRYWHNSKRQKYGSKHYLGNYNGTDYMLLYNLYHLIYFSDLPVYELQ